MSFRALKLSKLTTASVWEKLRQAEFLKVRKETRIENSRKRKSATSYFSEVKNAEQNRRSASMIDPLSMQTGKGRTSCDQEICKNRFNENCELKEKDLKITIASSLAYSQLLLTRFSFE